MLILATAATTNAIPDAAAKAEDESLSEDIDLDKRCLQILLTNDDGYDTTFIKTLFKEIRDNTCHDAIIVAPMLGQSLSSGSARFYEPNLPMANPEDGVYFLDSLPFVTLLFGLDIVAPDNNFVPDFVISGPNTAYNVGHGTINSGTVGATVTALSRGLPAMAVSSGSTFIDDPIVATTIAKLTIKLIDTKIIKDNGDLIIGEGKGLNVNIPTPRKMNGDYVPVDDFEFKLTKVGAAEQFGPKFFSDLGDSPATELLFEPDLAEFFRGQSGMAVDFPYTAAGYPLDADPDSEANALGITAGPFTDPNFVVTVSPIEFTYETPPSDDIKEAFEEKRKRPKNGKKKKKPKRA